MSENLTIDGNTNKGLTLTTLKYIAIAAMLIDHIAVTFVAYDSVLFLIMDLIGRITGPVMFFAAVEGYHHTKSFQKYLLLSRPMDYGTLCITIMLVLDFFYGDRKNQLAGYLIVILLETDILNFFLAPVRSFLFDNTFDV